MKAKKIKITVPRGYDVEIDWEDEEKKDKDENQKKNGKKLLNENKG